MSRKTKTKTVRTCVRCGCSEHFACAQGCVWVASSNVCSACLTPHESRMWVDLTVGLSDAQRMVQAAEASLDNAHTRLESFGRMVELLERSAK